VTVAELHQLAFTRVEQVLQSGRGDPYQALTLALSHILTYRRDLLVNFLIRKYGPVIQNGPFAGMRYLERVEHGDLVPKLIGCYEAELHEVILRVARRPYRQVVNIGCAEGYYAVGLARLLPGARVFAFDVSESARALCGQLAALNGVTNRVVIGGACDLAQLRELAGPDTFIVCDCEGAEAMLLDPEQAPGLTQCDVLVELHDFLDPNLSRLVTGRFAATHDVALLPNAPRDPSAFPALLELSHVDRFIGTMEGRPGPTPWAFMVCRDPRGAV
jgi:hypothetical protein